MSVQGERCETCGSALERGQHYCLSCGARAASRSPQLTELVRRVQERFDAADAASDGAAGPAASGPPPGRARVLAPMSGLRLPPAKVSGLLVIVFLGFGALIGNAAGPHVSGTLAASARRLQVVLPPASAASGRTSAPSASATANEPPEAEAEAAPAPVAPETPSTHAARAPSPPASGAPSGTSPGGEGEGSTTAPAGSSPPGSASKLPPIRHVFVIMLSDQPYAAVFGPASTAPYLSGKLERQGELLVRYDAVAHEQLANEVALLSGQGPTAGTAANCPTYSDIAPAAPAGEQQVLGSGCVYPASTPTLGGQLSAKHLTWRSYVEGFDEPAAGAAGACARPALGQPDPTAASTPAGEAYATFRNPFLYFHSVTDSPSCATEDVGIAQLGRDLAAPARTPSFSYIVPDRCHDASSVPCRPGAAAGPAAADIFLERVVPQIMRSRAYRDSGLLVVTVDEAPSSGEFADSSSCCGQPVFPNLAAGTPGLGARGGGTVGALLLSPYIKGGGTSQEPFSHFSLLRTVEDLFGLGHLGYAARPGVKPLEAAIFTAARKG